MIDDAIGWARAAGQVLMAHFGRTTDAAQKSDLSNVVTAADLASEQTIVQAIRQRHPAHSIIAEESGCDWRDSEFTWVVDPLDGTSNFAAGIPWFGVLIALLRAGEPVLGVLHLPVSGDVYCAERGGGAFRDGHRISVTPEPLLSNVLWAWGMDAADQRCRRRTRCRAVGARAAAGAQRARHQQPGRCRLRGRWSVGWHGQPQHPRLGHRGADGHRQRGRRRLHPRRRHAARARCDRQRRRSGVCRHGRCAGAAPADAGRDAIRSRTTGSARCRKPARSANLGLDTPETAR